MNTLLLQFSALRNPGEHTLMVMDDVGRHQSSDLDAPHTISLVILQTSSPELG
jgi:hypothetical protein